jgi:hypothetical protein
MSGSVGVTGHRFPVLAADFVVGNLCGRLIRAGTGGRRDATRTM